MTTTTTLDKLKALNFTDTGTDIPRRLICSVEGHPRTGKTHFALGGPEPILYIGMDSGGEGLLQKFRLKGKHILDIWLKPPAGLSQSEYQEAWVKAKHAISECISYGEGTLVIDTDTEVYALARLAHFGKLTQVMPHHYGPVYAEMRDMVRRAYERPKLNVVYIYKTKPVYLNDHRTDQYEIDGYSGMRYEVQANLLARRTQQPNKPPRFEIHVQDCRQNPAVIGQSYGGEFMNLEFLLGMVHD